MGDLFCIFLHELFRHDKDRRCSDSYERSCIIYYLETRIASCVICRIILSSDFLSESLGSGAVTTKPKRRAYLLKRKALTTGFFDNKAKDEKEKGEYKAHSRCSHVAVLPSRRINQFQVRNEASR